jgi:hypothetical protein
MKFVDDTCSEYKCIECGREYQDRELRCKISQDDRLKLFNSVEGVEMHSPMEQHMAAAKYLPKDINPDQPNPDLITMNYVRMKQGLSSFWTG